MSTLLTRATARSLALTPSTLDWPGLLIMARDKREGGASTTSMSGAERIHLERMKGALQHTNLEGAFLCVMPGSIALMLPPFDTTDTDLLAALDHAREWLAVLAERDLLVSLDATIFDGTIQWEVLDCLDMTRHTSWQPVYPSNKTEGDVYLHIEMELREDLGLSELLGVFYLLYHLEFCTALDLEHLRGRLEPNERRFTVVYRGGYDFEPDLFWPRLL